MGELKATPGPWHWVGIGDEIYVETEHTKYIASLKQYGYSSEETQEANAHLIAAAPDMYMVLEEVFDEVENYMERTGRSVTWGEKAKAALAKARGEA